MPVTAESLIPWCRALVAPEQYPPRMPLEEYLAAIPRLGSFADVPSGTPVLVRGDVDCKPGTSIGQGDIRLRSMVPTLSLGQNRGWKQVIFGHIGRKPEGSLKAVAQRIGELLGTSATLVPDWWDEASQSITESAAAAVHSAPPGSILVLENTRRYPIERALWDATVDDVARLTEPLARFANQCAERIAKVYVNEALSAGSLDTSTTIVPAAMERVALGEYVAVEFDGPMRRCLAAELVVFSGLKADKLDDMEAMIARGTVRWVFTAGSLAMALKKAAARIEGGDFSLGVAEDPAHKGKPYYIPPSRVEQAKGMLLHGRAKGIEFVLPVDFVLADGRVSSTIGAGEQQFDVGPGTSELFELKIGQFIAQKRNHPAGAAPVAFYNGVFGMFEDPRFEEGTRRFSEQLRRMKEAGIEVYVGGGEGGAALEKYGAPDWVTHVFTAGGTVLNALGSKPVPYLQALAMAARR
ncbi:MAG: phosphoglycerate kinase [Planctomycetia bacterium]|nr:phosphoglycerate kinase [Planctomycetia bacterium]